MYSLYNSQILIVSIKHLINTHKINHDAIYEVIRQLNSVISQSS